MPIAICMDETVCLCERQQYLNGLIDIQIHRLFQ